MIMKRIIRNIARDLCGQTEKHWLTFYFCILLGIAALLVGIWSHTVHNICFGIMFLVFGRVCLNADFDPESPYEV